MKISKLLTIIFLMLPLPAFAQQVITLQEAVNTALSNNPDILSAEFSVEKEEATGLKVIDIPKLELFTEYEGIEGSISNYETRKIGIKQEFEFPLVYINKSAVQDKQIIIAKSELNKSINELKYRVKKNYLELQYLYERNKMLEELSTVNTEFSKVADIKYDAGATSNLETLRAGLSKIKIENEIKNNESSIRSSVNNLKLLLNTEKELIPSPEMNMEEYNLNKTLAIQTALNKNPDLQIVRSKKQKSDSKISLAYSELLPDISLSYFRQETGDNNNLYGFEISLGIPLFFWWNQSGNIKEANLEHKITSNDEVSLRKKITTDVSQAFEEYQNSLRQLNYFTSYALPEANEILRTSKISYEEGSIEYAEYLQALSTVSDTKAEYLKSILNYNLSIINLEKLTGEEFNESK